MHSLTEAGQSSPTQEPNDLVDAINQIFTLFQVNYHNQYYKAFPDTEILKVTKKLWMESLRDLPAATVLRGAEHLVRTQDFLPTLSQMLRACRTGPDGEPLPDLRSAYLEACTAPSPKAAFDWSHPIIYHAGRRTGWHLLATQPEYVSFPAFREHFTALEQAFLSGENLSLPEAEPRDEEAEAASLEAEEAKARIAELRRELKL